MKKCQQFLSIFSVFPPLFATITEMQDTRNVIDKFKGRSEAEIMKELDAKDHGLVIALENTERDLIWGRSSGVPMRLVCGRFTSSVGGNGTSAAP